MNHVLELFIYLLFDDDDDYYLFILEKKSALPILEQTPTIASRESSYKPIFRFLVKPFFLILHLYTDTATNQTD